MPPFIFTSEKVLNPFGQPVGLPLPDWTPPPCPPDAPMAGFFCRLERLSAKEHAPALWNAMTLDTEGKMWTYLPYGPFPSEQAYTAWLDDMSRRSDPLFYTIMDQTTQRPVGVASYLRIDPPNGVIEVGHLQFSPLLQRSRAATEAMFLMMERAFALGYRRYEWKCDALNVPSKSAALRLGFTFEGLFRQAVVVKGRNRDTLWFSIIDHEWPALRLAFQRWLAPENFDQTGVQRERLSRLTARGAGILWRGRSPISLSLLPLQAAPRLTSCGVVGCCDTSEITPLRLSCPFPPCLPGPCRHRPSPGCEGVGGLGRDQSTRRPAQCRHR